MVGFEGVVEVIEDEEDVSARESTKGKWAELAKLVGAKERVEEIAADLVEHYETRTSVLEGKAMVVTMSREICMELYAKIVALRPEWHDDDDNLGFVKVVMDAGITPQRRGESDVAYQKRIEPLIEPIRYHGRTKAARKRLAPRSGASARRMPTDGRSR